MADIYYLRPSEKQAANANLASPGGAEPGCLAIVLSLSQLAAIALRETLTIDRAFSPRLSEMVNKLHLAIDNGGVPAAASSTSAAFARRGAQGTAPARNQDSFAPSKFDALLAEAIAGGNIRLGSQQRLLGGGSAAHPAAVKMLADHVGVPPDILIARQNRTRLAAFSFASLAAAEAALNTVFRNNSMMIRGWAERGGRPPLQLRLQSKEPLGIIAHAGADQVTELRGIAVGLGMERVLGDPYLRVSMSVTAPQRR
jgi:hypothetical protein